MFNITLSKPFRFILACVMSFMTIYSAKADNGPVMNQEYTITDIDYHKGWNDYLVPGNAFISTATEAIITVSNAKYIMFKQEENWNKSNLREYKYNDAGIVGTLTVSGNLLTAALGGHIYFNSDGNENIRVTVLNKDANFEKPSNGGSSGGNTDNPDENTDNTPEDNTGTNTPSTGLTYLGENKIFATNYGEFGYSYTGTASTMVEGATINITATTGNFDLYLNSSGSGAVWYEDKPSYTLKAEDVTKLAATNYTFWIAAWNGTISKITITTPDGNTTDSGTGTTEPGGNTPGYEPDYSYQQDSNGDGKLEPCAEFPAFGALVDYNQYPQITEDVPTIYLTTENTFTWTAWTPKSEEYQNATIVIVDKNGTMKQRNETVTFRGRGNSTWNSGSKKKPWRLKFPTKTKLLAEQDANYNEINNYADAKSWTLLCNVYDKSLLRNALSHELGKRYGMEFCPAYRFVDLVINGNYQGTYQVSDHVQVDKNRVNVNSKTGWFVEFSTQNFAEDPYISVQAGNQSVLASIKNPETDIITSSGATTDTQYDDMKNWLGTMWTNLCNGANEYNTNAKSDYKAFRDMVDLKSLTGFVILQDLAGNYDGAMANVYAYKEATDSKLKFGPIWDLDLAYGNYSQLNGQHFWQAQSQGVGFLFANMWKDPYFVKELNDNWTYFKDGDGLNKFIKDKVETLAASLANTQANNYNTTGDSWRQWDNAWSISGTLGLGHGASSYEEAVVEITNYLASRITWLNTQIENQYSLLKCATLNPCTDFGHTEGYVLQSNGSYRKGCEVCGHLDEDDTQTYYQFTVYPESKKSTTIMATRWEPSADKPNSIAVVEAKQEVVKQIDGYNIVAGKKNTDGNLTCKDFRLTDGHPYYSENKFVAGTATYSRALTNAWGTLCLPFKTQEASTEYASFYHLDSYVDGSNGGAASLVFKPVEPEESGNCSAYMPVVFKATNKAMEENKLEISWNDITVKKNTELTTTASESTGWTLNGTVKEDATARATTDSPVYYIAQNKFWYAEKEVKISAFRAWYTVEAAGSEPAAAACRIVITDETSSIDEILPDDEQIFQAAPAPLYDLQGRPVSGTPTPGLYLRGSQKVLLR